ncbi:hypothetical protein [Salinivibrio sp. KP-1]|uniref:hypothetical protein n=1 Tax=Salinivibrio sp. KP-1 TaxID=1406902 RepID=UPI0006146885|nr:hypothetical protein [Salinivibrio sp. KP-1]KKA44663.1 hypothetical protein WN56_08975 [Salinivibrio sp. KP-1]
MKALTAIYRQREPGCQQAHEQADRTCPSGCDPASRYLHQPHDNAASFVQLFKRSVAANSRREVLLAKNIVEF